MTTTPTALGWPKEPVDLAGQSPSLERSVSTEDALRVDLARRQKGQKRRKRQRRHDLMLAGIMVLAGIAVMFYPKLTDVRYEFAQWRLSLAAIAAPVLSTTGDSAGGGVALPEGVVARLEIPAIGLQAYVVEGTQKSQLTKGPGHYPGTPLPGESGNVAIAGHRTMYGHVFHDLHLLEAGDVIRTATSATTATYRVVEIRVVSPRDTHVAAATDDSRLTLTTCNPIGSAAQRLVVVAELDD